MEPITGSLLGGLFLKGLLGGAGTALGSNVIGEMFAGSPVEPGKAPPPEVGAGYGQALANIQNRYDTRLQLPSRQPVTLGQGRDSPRHDRLSRLTAIGNIQRGLAG